MEYDRFTKHKIADGKGVYEKGVHYIEKLQSDTSILHRLAELEDKIEKGLMIELPCKVGDIVYFPIVDRFDYAEIENIHITDKEIIFEWVQYDRGYELTEVWDNGEFTLDDIGKTVFLTREAAEAKLLELQNK